MIATVINIDVFEQPYRSGLLFSLFEGLRPGEGFRITSHDGLEEIKKQFITAQVQNLKLQELKSNQGLSEVEIVKTADHKVGCCGMCGG